MQKERKKERNKQTNKQTNYELAKYKEDSDRNTNENKI